MSTSLFPHIFSKGSAGDYEGMGRRELILIFFLGILVRFFVYHNTFIINPDGVLYIHQARALYYKDWGSVISCGMSYLSIYPILITGAYGIFHDWVVAARSISLFFGSITMIPLYFLMRRFCNKEICAMGTLVFALIPVFVDKSVDVVRGPIYWFFLVLGLYLFVTQIGNRRYRLYLVLSCLSFLVAAWARIEAVLFIIVSCCYLLAVRQEKRVKRLGTFVLPIAFLFLVAISYTALFSAPTKDIFRISEIPNKLYAPFIEYRNLRGDLSGLAEQPAKGSLEYFLENARHLVWLVALGTLLIYTVKAFFYPFFLVFIVGMGGLWRKVKKEERILYLTLLSFTALVILYFHTVQSWQISARFLALFILPAFIFVAFGLEKTTQFLKRCLHLRGPAALSITCALILALALPKCLKPRESDKLVFRVIGQVIAERQGNGEVIPIVASLHTIRWVSFYANLGYPGVECPQPYEDFAEVVGTSYRQFVQNLKKRGTEYFLWEERHWPVKGFDFLKRRDPRKFPEVGRWRHPDTGQMILFRVL